MKYTELSHSSHPQHKLKLVHHKEPYKCNGCHEIGFGLRYSCDDCGFDLHKDCAFGGQSNSSHTFYSGCDFKFYNHPPGEVDRFCDACGRDVKGFVYHCVKCGKDLHPCCKNLTTMIQDEGMELSLQKKVSSKCSWCGNRKLWGDVTGWSYVSSCQKFHFHISCVKEILVKRWEKGQSFPEDDQDAPGNTNLSLHRNTGNLQLSVKGEDTSKHGEKIRKYWRMVKMVVKVILSALLGDPTVGVAWIIEYLASSSTSK